MRIIKIPRGFRIELTLGGRTVFISETKSLFQGLILAAKFLWIRRTFK